jgi:hypothetical protein
MGIREFKLNVEGKCSIVEDKTAVEEARDEAQKRRR